MHEIKDNSNNNVGDPKHTANELAVTLPNYASGWRAFFSIVSVDFLYLGEKVSQTDFDNYYQFKYMFIAKTVCHLGVWVAAFFAIKWRKLENYWSIVWRLYLISIIVTVLSSTYIVEPNSFGSALGVSVHHGSVTIIPGVAFFYTRNKFTNFIYYLITGLMIFILISGLANKF